MSMSGMWSLDRRQWAVVALFAFLGALQGWLVLAGIPHESIRGLKFGEMVLLFVVGLAARPRTPTRRLLVVALGLSALADAFTVRLVDLPSGLSPLVGMGIFLLAYVALIGALWRGRPRASDGWLAVPFLLAAAVLFVSLWGYLPPVMRIAMPVFAVVLLLMGWTTACALTRGYFNRRVSVLVASAGVLLVASDFAVSFEMVYPPFSPVAPVGVEAFVRLTYLVGWLLLLLVVLEKHPVSAEPRDAATRLTDHR